MKCFKYFYRGLVTAATEREEGCLEAKSVRKWSDFAKINARNVTVRPAL